MQLHRVCSAVNSAVVAQEDQHGGGIGPVVAEPAPLARVVLELETGEIVGGRDGARRLAFPGCSEQADDERLPAMRIAVVDLGTNSTRLLVADVEGGRVTELDRRSIVTRLGERVDSTGRLADAAKERVHAAVAGFREAIDALGAERTVAVATSAMRDAANGAEFRTELRERHGIEARTISGDEEARLTFRGATAARAPGARTVVIDIGGGSTEFVVGRAGEEPEFHVSTQAGSVRQTERHLPSDPVPDAELATLRAELRAIIAGAVPAGVRDSVEHGIAVAGTATSLTAIDQALAPDGPDRIDGYMLTLAAVERILEGLAAIPLAERREVAGLHPDRAPMIVAGAAILAEGMAAFALSEVEMSEADILHGAALQAASD
jgi:exopolyphosphatase/guanosine-5'-triphosphate,3'-diphosphate pyrophosphatase